MCHKKLAQYIFLALFFYLSIVSCNYNPLGGSNSHIDEGNTPFLSTPAPFSINGVLAFDGQVNLTWATSQRADDYSVVYGTSSGSYPNTVANCTAIKRTLCSVPNLVNGTTYYFNVVARNLFGTLNAIKQVKVTPNPFSIFVKPSSGTALVSWGDVSGGIGNTNYTLQYGTSPTSISQSVSGITNPFLLTGLTDGQFYYFQVIASNAAGTIYSLTVSALVISPPSATTINPPIVSSANNTLSWNAATGAGTIVYTVYRGVNSGGPYDAVPGCIALNAFTCIENATNLISGNTYYYIVIAMNEGGDSPDSNEVNGTSFPDPPGGLSITAPTSSTSLITWGESPGNADITYNIYRSLTTPVGIIPGNNIGTVNSTFLSPNLSYTDNGLFAENSIYYYSLTSTNISGSSGKSPDQSISSALLTDPTGLSASSVDSSSVTLNWNLSVGNAPLTFSVYRSLISSPASWDSPVYTGNSTSFEDTSLQENTNYYYMVSAVNDRPNAVPRQSVVYATVTALQTPPSFNPATNITYNSITLNWNALPNNGVVTYNLFRSTVSNPGSWGAPIFTTTTATTYTDNTGLSENTIYYYKVTATNSAPGATTLSSQIYEISTDLLTIPTFILPATNVMANSLTLSWNPSPNNGTVSYSLYRSPSGIPGTFNGPINIPSSLTSFTDSSGLNENTIYYYMVTATNAVQGGTTRSSVVVNVTTALDSAPILNVSSVSTGSVNLQWTSSNGDAPVQYNIYRSTTLPVNTSGVAICANISVTTCSDNTVSASNTYYYVVTATNSINSVTSPAISVTTLPNAPTAPTIVATDGNIVITWTQSPGAGIPTLLSYDVQRSRVPGSGFQDVSGCTSIPDSTGGSCPDVVPIVDGSPYYYRVIANTSGGPSPTASPATIVTPITPVTSVNLLVTSSQITLSWSGAIGGSAFAVYNSTTPDGSDPANGGISTGCTSSPCVFTVTPGQTFYYSIQASNSAANSSATTLSTEYAAVVYSSTYTAITAQTGQVFLAWNPVADATNYSIYYSTTSGQAISGNQVGCNAILSLSCTVTGLINGQAYYFAIVITRSVGGTFNGTEETATPIGNFDIISVSPESSSTATINWSVSPGATTYEISYGTSTGNYTQKIPSVSASVTLPYTVTGLLSGAVYYFMVTAKNASGAVNANAEQQLQMEVGPPTGLTASAASKSSVSLNWNIFSGNPTVTYKVYRSNSNAFPFVANPTNAVCSVLSTSSPNSSCTDSGLVENTKYYYVMTASNVQGESQQSSPVVAATTALVTVPTFKATTNLLPTSVTLNWNASPNNGAVTYSLYRSTTGAAGTWGSPINTPSSATTFEDNGLSENTKYYYMVSAINTAPGAIAVNSASMLVTTSLSSVPTFITPATNVTSNSITLNWNASPNNGAVTYSLYRSTTSVTGPWVGPINIPSSARTYIDSGRTENTKYYYMVSASNNGGTANLNSVGYMVTTALQTVPAFITSSTISAATSVTLNWSLALNNGAVTYKLYKSVNSSGPWGSPINTLPNATTFKDTGLSENTINYYMVTATGSDPGATTLSSASYAVSTNLQSIPTFNAATNITSSSVTLNWNAYPNNGAVTFKLFRSTTSSPTSWGSPINTPSSATSFIDNSGLAENTTYYYMVTATNTAVGPITQNSVALPVTTSLVTAPILKNLSVSTNSANFQWNSVDGTAAATYSLYRSTTLPVNTTGSAICTNLTSNTCTDSTVVSSSKYFYVITATNSQNKVTSSPINITTLPNAPTAPNATATDGSVVITWPQSPGAGTPALLNYMVLRSRVLGGTYQEVVGCTNVPDANGGSCTDIVPTVDGNPYYYKVTAMTSGGNSPTASPVTTVTPITPVSSVNVVTSSTNIILSWGGATGASIYAVYSSTTVDSSSPGDGGTLTACTSSPCNFTVGTIGQTIYYTIVAKNTAVNSSASTQSSEVSATPLSSQLVQVSAKTSQVTVSWGTVTNATNYKIYYSKVSGQAISGNVLGCDAGLNLTCPITGLTNGQLYYFALLVTRSVGGNFQSIEVKGTPIGSFSITSVTPASNTANVVWTSAAGAASYDVSYGIVSGTYTNSTTVAAGGGATQSAPINPLKSGTQYFFMVKAKNADNGSVNASAEFYTVTIPVAPININFEGTSYNSATIQWDNNTSNVPITYKVYRSTQSSFNITDTGVVFACSVYSTLANPTQLSCLDNTAPAITENTIYYYKIVAVTNDIGGVLSKTSTPSSATSVITPFNSTDSFSLNASNLTATSLTLNWTFNVGSQNISYSVYQSNSANAVTSGAIINCSPALAPSPPSTANACKVTGLMQNQKYYFAVVASNGQLIQINTNDLMITTPIATNTSFSVTASNVLNTSVTLNWTFNFGNTNINYKIFQGGVPVQASQVSTCSLSNITPSNTQLTCNVTGLSQNSSYSFTIQASNSATGGASSVTSPPITVNTKFTTGTTFNLTLGTVTDTTATVNWVMNVGNSTVNYSILQGGVAVLNTQVSTCSLANVTPSSTQMSCKVTGLTQNSDYSFSIQASNNATGGVTSITSSILSVTTNFTSGTSFNLSSSSILATSFTLSWTFNVGSSNVDYTILQDGSPITTSCSLTAKPPSSTAVTCNITGLSENTTYSYSVKATNSTLGSVSFVTSTALSVITPPQTAPSGLKATITDSKTISMSWNAYALGNTTVTYKIYASTSSTVSLINANIFCNNVSISSCSNTQVSGTNLAINMTYYFVVVVSNASGTSVASTPSVGILFAKPANTVAPSITGLPASGIANSAGINLTGSLGTWSDSSSCTYQWYSNGIAITTPDGSGTITTANSPVSYLTKITDVCEVISFGVTCTNGIGSSSTIYNNSLSSSLGIDTNSIVNSYSTRVSTVTAGAKSQIKSFLDQLISNKLPLPNVMYPMLASQNAGSGTTLYDLFCDGHNATIASGLTWDNTGGIIINSGGLATIPNIFTGSLSTIIAVNRSPILNGNKRGVAGYTVGGNNSNSFGYGDSNFGSSIIFERFSSNPSIMIMPLSQGRFDFWGVSMNGTNVTLQQNEYQHPDTTAAGKSGGLILGSFNGSPNTGLQDYMAFASAWNASAFSALQMETVRRIAQATVVSSVQNFPKYMYVGNANVYTGSTYSVSFCQISNIDGSLSSCAATGTGFKNPIGTARFNNFIYSVNVDSSAVKASLNVCQINNSDGTLINGTCQTIQTGLPVNSYGLVASKGLPKPYLYIGVGNDVKLCTINSASPDGVLNGSCGAAFSTNPLGGTAGSLGLTFSYMNTNPYLYIANRPANQIWKCNVNLSNGILSSCAQTGSNFSGPTGIVINNGYAYTSNASGSSVTKCTVNATDGNFSNCAIAADNTSTGLTQFKSTEGVTIINNYIYIANWQSDTIIKCLISVSDGSLSGCAVTGNSFKGPIGMAY